MRSFLRGYVVVCTILGLVLLLNPAVAVRLILTLVNCSLLVGVIFGVMILLRPVTNRLISPQHRVFLWMAGWVTAFWPAFYEALRGIPLPISFAALAFPEGLIRSNTFPALVADLDTTGENLLLLPNLADPLPIPLERELQLICIGVTMAILVASMVVDLKHLSHLRRAALQGTLLSPGELVELGMTRADVAVRLCDGLPTSYVCRSKDPDQEGSKYVVFLQRELPRERLTLVLRHEEEHIRQSHLTFKSIISGAMLILWWNPVLWLAARLTFRDMELACDEGVLADLDADGRREYARILVDLGVGRAMWGPVATFGECDASLRVRRVVAWKERSHLLVVLSFLAALALGLFFYCGASPAPDKSTRWLVYLGGHELAQDMDKYLDLTRRDEPTPPIEVKQVWWYMEDSAFVQDVSGQWYSCTFQIDDYEGDFDVSLLREMPPPDPTLRDYKVMTHSVGE